MGPLKDKFLPVEPKGVEITIPSPQNGANNIKSLYYSNLTYKLSRTTPWVMPLWI